MSGPTYVSHPSLFRHKASGENFIPSIRRKKQKGGGILNRRKAYMIPVQTTTIPRSEIPQVTPVAADRDRALSDLKETVRNDEPHMPLRKTIKKNIQKKTHSRTSTAQGKGRAPPKGKKPSAKAQKGKKKPAKSQKGKGRPEFPVPPII